MSQEENFSLASSWPVFLSFLLPHFRLAHCLLRHEAEVTDLKLKSPGKMDKKDTQKKNPKETNHQSHQSRWRCRSCRWCPYRRHRPKRISETLRVPVSSIETKWRRSFTAGACRGDVTDVHFYFSNQGRCCTLSWAIRATLHHSTYLH